VIKLVHYYSGVVLTLTLKIMLSPSTLYSGALDFDSIHEKERERDNDALMLLTA